MRESGIVDGWPALIEWFGEEPDFHDAELISIDLRRDPEPSFVRVSAWRTLWDSVDENGYYVTDRHAVVTFALKGITALSLDGWAQNVLDNLSIIATDDVFTLRMPTIYGIEGEISAKSISATVEPTD